MTFLVNRSDSVEIIPGIGLVFPSFQKVIHNFSPLSYFFTSFKKRIVVVVEERYFVENSFLWVRTLHFFLQIFIGLMTWY